MAKSTGLIRNKSQTGCRSRGSCDAPAQCPRSILQMGKQTQRTALLLQDDGLEEQEEVKAPARGSVVSHLAAPCP